jgi:hypothetical protein
MPAVEVQHYETASGRDPIAEFLEAQPVIERAACDLVIDRLADGTIDQFPRLRAYVGDGIWELRVSSAGKQFRFLYAVGVDEPSSSMRSSRRRHSFRAVTSILPNAACEN